MKISTISICEDLDKYKRLWQEAFDNHRGTRYPFLDFDLVSTYAQYFLNNQTNRSLHIVIFNDNNKIAILPFYYINKGYRQLNLIGRDLFDYGDIIANSTDISAVRDFFINNKADFVKLFHVRNDSAVLRILEPLIQDKNDTFNVIVEDSVNSPYLALDGYSWETYWNSLKRKFKTDLLRRTKKLSSLGSIEFNYCQNIDEVAKVTNIMFEQHIRRRKFLGQKRSIFTDEKVRAFFYEINKKMFLSSKLFLFYLKLNNGIISILECFLYDNILYHYVPTFDVNYSQYSPGRILNQHMIRFAIDNHFKEIDFMIGDEEYKLEWNASIRHTQDISFFRNSLFGRVAFLNSRLESFFGLIKEKLIRSKLKNIKRQIFKRLYKTRL